MENSSPHSQQSQIFSEEDLQYCDKNFSVLDEKSIYYFEKLDPSAGINNVLQGFCKECFMVVIDELDKRKFELIYITLKESYPVGHHGYFSSEIPFSRLITLMIQFNREISSQFNTNHILTFNAFQKLRKQMLEKYKILTLGKEVLDYGDSVAIMAPGFNGIEWIYLFDIVEIYRKMFPHCKIYDFRPSGDSFVYLKVNARNGYIKIGQSKDPVKREKTLQSENPDNHLIAYWVAPKEIETELHRKFKSLRVRGEWFDIKTEQLHEIKGFMNVYE